MSIEHIELKIPSTVVELSPISSGQKTKDVKIQLETEVGLKHFEISMSFSENRPAYYQSGVLVQKDLEVGDVVTGLDIHLPPPFSCSQTRTFAFILSDGTEKRYIAYHLHNGNYQRGFTLNVDGIEYYDMI